MTTSDWLLVVTAVLTGVATIITAYAGLVRSKRDARSDAEDECHEKLRALRRENEQVADELHELRMRRSS
jgi:Tfp pilus assembly protein PilO